MKNIYTYHLNFKDYNYPQLYASEIKKRNFSLVLTRSKGEKLICLEL